MKKPSLKQCPKRIWDYLNESQRRWNIFILVGIALYFILIGKFIKTRPDHIFLALLVFSFVFLGKKWGRMLLVDWSPWIIFWISYDMMRGIADTVRGNIHIREVFECERMFFGWLTSAEIPAFYFQSFQKAHEGELVRAFLDVFTSNVYALHFLVPLVLGWILWHTLNERRNYYEYVHTMTLLNFMALVTFMLYPAAPPWYVFNHGFGQPTGEFLDSAGSLVNFDALIGTHFFRSIWNTFNSNPFAAIPSLHAGYPTAIAFFIWKRFKGKNWLWFIYPLSAWFSAVYLNHHYIIDLILGSLYFFIAYWIAKFLLTPKIFDRFVNYDLNPKRVWIASRAKVCND